MLLPLPAYFHLNCLAGRSPNLSSNFPALFSSPMEKKKKGKKRVREAKVVSCKSNVEDIEDFSPQEVVKIRVSLLRWYYENQRVLPWRINQDEEEKEEGGEDEREARAYAVWVSEVMLQQTRVSTVIDYYNRWMEKWPNFRHLAEASQEVFHCPPQTLELSRLHRMREIRNSSFASLRQSLVFFF